jgi:hypothetical protein
MAGGALDYVVRMVWGPGRIAYYGPYTKDSAKRVANLCDRMADVQKHPDAGAGEIIELERYFDPSQTERGA